jgi:hypothetical protein
MTDLTDLDEVSGDDLTEEQIKGILAQIDLDITNLVREGKLSALNYTVGGPAGRTADRAGNLRALLEARTYYQQLLESQPSWNINMFDEAPSRKQKTSR